MAWTQSRGKAKWRGRYRDLDGVTRSTRTVATKREAKALGEEEEAKLRAGTWTDPTAGNMTLATYFTEHWLPNRVYEVNTVAFYESVWRSAIAPEFGEVPLKAITFPVVQRWVVRQTKEDSVAAGTVVARYKVLQTILAAKKGVSAVRDKLIAANPCDGVTLPVVDKRQVHVYSVEEVDALMRAMGWWSPLVLFLAETGARWGEAMGAWISDFDNERSAITLSRTVVETSKARSDNGTCFIYKERTKGRRSRHVALSPEVGEMVGKLIVARHLFGQDRLFSVPNARHDGLPLRTEAWSEGVPPFRRTVRDAWLRAHEESGVEREGRRIHDLRGSHITWLAAGGADIVTIMARVGHTRIDTTQLYLDAMADADTRALAALRATQQRGRRGA